MPWYYSFIAISIARILKTPIFIRIIILDSSNGSMIISLRPFIFSMVFEGYKHKLSRRRFIVRKTDSILHETTYLLEHRIFTLTQFVVVQTHLCTKIKKHKDFLVGTFHPGVGFIAYGPYGNTVNKYIWWIFILDDIQHTFYPSFILTCLGGGKPPPVFEVYHNTIVYTFILGGTFHPFYPSHPGFVSITLQTVTVYQDL